MSLLEKTERPPARSRGIAALITAVVGTGGIIAFYFLGPELQALDVTLLFVVVVFVALGSAQSIIRGAMTAVALYLASALAAIAYHLPRPYARSFLDMLRFFSLNVPPEGNPDYDALALSFLVLIVILWIALEVLNHSFFPHVRLPALGFLDRVGGALIYLVIGVVVATLLFAAIGYSQMGKRAHHEAYLRPRVNQVLRWHYTAQSFWFSRRPPGIYVYDLE